MSRSVVLTGASSFVGLHLAEHFAQAGWSVSAVHGKPLSAYEGIRKARLDRLAGQVTLVQADLADPSAAARLTEQAQPTLWIQHAGYADNYGSMDYDLSKAHALNVAALDPIYHALAGASCGVIITGSSMEYSASDQPNHEDDLCQPDTPYGLSKLTETLRARQLCLRHDVPTRVARLYIPFGGLDNPAKLLSQVVSALRQGKPVDLSAGLQQRDFLGVSDVCSAYLALAENMSQGDFDLFNVSSGQATSLRELLTLVASQIGASPELLRFGALPMRAGETSFSVGANDKARETLAWRPMPQAQAIDRDLLQAE